MTNNVANRIDAWIAALTRFSVNSPWVVLITALLILGTSVAYASNLEIHGSFVHLLPTWDETAERYHDTRDRKGGSGSTLQVMVESPNPKKNKEFIDELESRVKGMSGVTRVDHGPEELRAFYMKWKWLLAEERDLALVECELNKARERATPGYVDLEDPCSEQIEEEYGKAPEEAKTDEKTNDDETKSAEGKSAKSDQEEEDPLTRFDREMKKRVAEVDRYPTGYYRNPEGTQYLLTIYASGAGMGEFSSDQVFKDVRQIVAETNPQSYHPDMQVGYAGSIPNAIEERDALINDIFWVSTLALALILLAIVVFFRSPVVLLHIGLCMGTGTALAFAAAMFAYGHLNSATSFLVAIVAGNGINHGIVYLARYRERRAAGDGLEDALVEAAVAIRKGTWLAALAATGAFGCLLLTSFRGFSEFGLIGGVGMVACWVATFAVLPASVSAVDRVWRALRGEDAPHRSPRPPRLYGANIAAAASKKAPWVVLGIAAVLTITAAWPLPSYLSDPWEYNFSKLGSQKSKKTGAGRWSSKASKLTKRRGEPVMVLADDMNQALDLARQLEENDKRLGGDRYIERVETIYNYLGGPPEEVERKLALLDDIRDHIDAVQKRLKGEQARIAKDWRPPERLRPLRPDDLPPLLTEMFSEKNGKMGTPVYAFLSRNISQSNGENILAITGILEAVRLPGDRIAPNASRASVFAAIIRSLERDAPRATLAALLLVVVITLSVTRRFVPAAAVIGSLLAGILLTVGGAAWLGVRLNFLNFVAIPLTFGICVEYAVNLYERMRVHGGDVAAGIRSAGGPVFLCSLTTILGYGSLLVADNRALQSFGKYAIAGEISCILTALLVMPAALHALSPREAKTGTAPKAQEPASESPTTESGS